MRGIEDWNLVHLWLNSRCILYTGIRLLLLIRPFMSSFFFLSNYQTFKAFVTFFSRTVRSRIWNLVHTWIVGRRIVYTGIKLLLLICPFISFFFLSNFQTLKLFVILFSRTVRPRKLKIGTHVDNGQMYRIYRNQAAAAYSSFISSFSFSPIFNIEFLSHFSRELWGLEDWNLVDTWTVGRCIMYTRIRLLLLILPFISSFFFLSNFQHWNFSSHFSREVWGLEDWQLVHTWTVGRCIMYTRIRLLLFIRPFILLFFSPIFNIDMFHHTFLRNCEA